MHRVWGQLPTEVLQALARSLSCFCVEPQTLIYQEGQTPIGLYLLKWGTVEIFRQSLIGKSLIRYRSAGDLLGYTLVANAAEAQYQTSAVALTASEILFLPQAAFQTLIANHLSIQQLIHKLLSQELNEYTARLSWERVRIQGLQSYIQPVPTDAVGILGKSKAAQKLMEQVNQSATHLDPILLQAQAGTGKTFLAGLIHARSGLLSHPFAELDCANLPRAEDGRLSTDALFDRVGQRPGILELLERGTLLLDNVQVLGEGDRIRLSHYLKTGLILPNYGIMGKTDLDMEPPQPIQIDALPNEGQATGGCPLYSHPAQLQDNRDCMLCMTCLKTCPNRSAQLNLRFPASDLLDHHQGFGAEAALLLLLFGGVFMHHADQILAWLGVVLPVDADHLLSSVPIALLLLCIPAVLTYIAHGILLRITKRPVLNNMPHLLLMFGFTVFFFKLMM